MKKLLLFVLILSCTETFSQATVDSILFLKKEQLKDSIVSGKAVKVLIEPLATSLAPVVNSTKVTVESLTADLKSANDRIARLEALAPGIPEPIILNSNYTLTANDNGKTIYVYTNATITLPVLAEGIKCKVYRMGNGRPRFVASGITLRLRSGFTPLSVQYAAVNIDYKEGEVVVE